MTVKELVEIFNVYGIEVIFDSCEEVAKNLNGHIVYFACVDGKEREKYEKSKTQPQFISKHATIHMPNLTLEELVDIYKCDGGNSYELVQSELHPFLSYGLPEDVLFVTFIFLHEIGHWVHFNEIGKNVYDFQNLNLELYKANSAKRNELEVNHQKRMERGSDCPITAKEKRQLIELTNEYHQIPKEMKADQFARNELKEAIGRIITGIS